MSRLCVSKKKKYPYIKFTHFAEITQSSLGFNKELTIRMYSYEIEEFNNKYPEYAIEYDKDKYGDALIKVHIPANGDAVIGGTITVIKDNATESKNYTTYETEMLSGEECDDLDTIFTARLYGNELSIWRTDDGKLYIKKLMFVYHSNSITRHISRNRNRKPFGFAYRTEIGSDNMYKKKVSINVEKSITITGAQIIHSNLRGVEEEYNRAGHGYIMFKLPDGLAFLNCKGGYLKVNIAEHVIPTIKIDNHVYDGSYADFDNLVRGGAIARIEAKPVSFTNAITKEAKIIYYLTELDVAKYTIKDLYSENLKAKERKNVMPENFEKVVVNGPATIAWINGEKIMVKKSEEDPYDYEKAMLALMVKSFFGNEARFHRWCKDNMKLINKAIEKDAKVYASKASKKHSKVEEKPTHKPNRHDRWTRKELDFLLANYKEMTNKAIGEALGRSYASVQTQLFRLHLKR